MNPIYYLHVTAGDDELHFEHEPRSCKSLRVEVLAIEGTAIEETRTRNIRDWAGAFCTITLVRPKGIGWAVHDATADNFTVWRRKVFA